MKKITTFFILIFLTTQLLFAQDVTNSIIINSKESVVEHVDGKTIKFYIKGISQDQLKEFGNKVSSVNGVSLLSLKTTDEKLKMSYGQIELKNTYNKKGLIAILNHYKISTVVYNGQPMEMEKYILGKQNREGVSNN